MNALYTMRNALSAIYRASRSSDLTATTSKFDNSNNVSLTTEQFHPHTRQRTKLSGGIISGLSIVLRPTFGRSPGDAGARRFPSAVAAATLAGFAGTPSVVEATGALLSKRLLENRGEQFQDAPWPTATESAPLALGGLSPLKPPSPETHHKLDHQVHVARGELEDSEPNQDTCQVHPSSLDALSTLSDSIRSLGVASSPPPSSPLGVYRQHFASLSSSSLGSSAAQAPAQAQVQTLHSSSSTSSFVSALANDRSPRSSILNRAPFGILNRCESPNPMHPFRRPLSGRRPLSAHVPIAADSICDLVSGACQLAYEHRCQALGFPCAVAEELSESALGTNDDPTRRTLIIGNSYRRDTRRTHTTYSITTLPGVDNDIPLLKEAFQERGYIVEVLNHDGFHRKDVLDRVAAFLGDAKPGHIRAIAYTGHACTGPEGAVVLVPPHCPTLNMAITQAEWENTIQKNAKAGSIVFSIMAHCFSGGFMKQEKDCQTWKALELASDSYSAFDKPIFITFASSTSSQSSFESTVEREDPEKAQDHFLYALAKTIKATEVHNWEAFFVTFKRYFDRARSGASWAERSDKKVRSTEEGVPVSEPEHTPTWRPANSQDPSFSASEILGYINMFLPPKTAQ